MLNRRELLGTAVTAGAAACLTGAVPAQADALPPFRIIDTNVNLFQWPFRRLPLDETEALVNRLRSLGVAQAWAGSFEGLLHREIAGVNLRLAAACKGYPGILLPIGTVNPELPDWEEDLRRCAAEHHMPGIRLHPNYHGYTLDSPRFAQLLQLAAEAGLFVQIAASMEDTRTQHQLMQTPDVDLTPLARVLRNVPAKVQVLNYRPRPPLLEQLAAIKNIYFDTARVEGTDTVPQLVERVSSERVLYGSHAPFFVPEAALIRVHESGKLGDAGLRRVFADNAEQLSAQARTKT